jgi:hypothetical protein
LLVDRLCVFVLSLLDYAHIVAVLNVWNQIVKRPKGSNAAKGVFKSGLWYFDRYRLDH